MDKTDKEITIAVFASGNGSNAENIINFFNHSRHAAADATQKDAKVGLVVCNRPDAFVTERARTLNVPVEIVTREQLNDETYFLGLMDKYNIGFIALAGFLLMIPSFLIGRYQGRIVNIHPSLLPKYGGKGMYGHHIHEAVVAAGEKETGITIHHVSDRCDEGAVIFQTSVTVESDDTPATVEKKIHALERKHYPAVIAEIINP